MNKTYIANSSNKIWNQAGYLLSNVKWNTKYTDLDVQLWVQPNFWGQNERHLKHPQSVWKGNDKIISLAQPHQDNAGDLMIPVIKTRQKYITEQKPLQQSHQTITLQAIYNTRKNVWYHFLISILNERLSVYLLIDFVIFINPFLFMCSIST